MLSTNLQQLVQNLRAQNEAAIAEKQPVQTPTRRTPPPVAAPTAGAQTGLPSTANPPDIATTAVQMVEPDPPVTQTPPPVIQTGAPVQATGGIDRNLMMMLASGLMMVVLRS
jgi:hypothetical protein